MILLTISWFFKTQKKKKKKTIPKKKRANDVEKHLSLDNRTVIVGGEEITYGELMLALCSYSDLLIVCKFILMNIKILARNT